MSRQCVTLQQRSLSLHELCWKGGGTGATLLKDLQRSPLFMSPMPGFYMHLESAALRYPERLMVQVKGMLPRMQRGTVVESSGLLCIFLIDVICPLVE